jgi:drug/metabolite transporter (DMT)-like permease
MLYKQNIILGSLFILLSEFLFASMGALVKTVAAELPNEVIVFFRNVIGLVLLSSFLFKNKSCSIRTDVLPLHILRGVMGVSAMYCFFYALGHLRLADGMLLKMTSPLFIPFIAWLWLKESAPKLALLAIPVGFFGVIFILKPGIDFNWIVLIGLLGGFFAAVAKTTVRRLGHSEPTFRVVFYFSLVSTFVSIIPMFWAWQMPSNRAWLLLLGLSITGTFGQLFLTRGYALARSSQVAPFTYFSVIFGASYGYFFWGEVLDIYFITGALLIAVAGLLAIKSGNKKTAQDKTAT